MATTSTPIPQEKPQKARLAGRRNLFGGSYFDLTRNEVSTDDISAGGALLNKDAALQGTLYAEDLCECCMSVFSPTLTFTMALREEIPIEFGVST